MANLQKHFELFHNRIRVSNEPLTEKRDIILNVIRDYLKKNNLPSFELINQGSYIYGVGIRPTGENEYDIDVGLAFNIKTSDYPDARIVRNWVLKAVEGHTSKVRDRGPCIRVHYARGFHVDLVVYAKHTNSTEMENLRLGKNDGSWAPSDPKKLKEYIKTGIAKFKDTKVEGEATQIQRIVRALKRWNDLRLPEDTSDKPTGISLLLLSIEKLSPRINSSTQEPDDLAAMTALCDQIIPSGYLGRISVFKPTPEHEDVFGKISLSGMKDLVSAFSTLKEELRAAQADANTVSAAKKLQKLFGDNFPVMETIKKSDISNSLQLDEAEVTRLAKIEALHAIAATAKETPKPWSK